MDDSGDRGPLLGALLRRSHMIVAARVDAGLLAEGLEPLQGAVTQPLWDAPMRLTDLAAAAGITKQSMSELVERMIDAGYVERIPDASDGRARLLRLTHKGQRASRIARQVVRDVEAEWCARFGTERVEAMERLLREIVSG
jgi:DNA-binding MarR family transcriptional regulator